MAFTGLLGDLQLGSYELGSFNGAFDSVSASNALSEDLALAGALVVPAVEGLTLSERFAFGVILAPSETLTLTESFVTRYLGATPLSGGYVRLSFPEDLQTEGGFDHYKVTQRDGGFPLTLKSVTPEFNSVASGSDGRVVPTPKGYGSAVFGTVSGISTLTDPDAKFSRWGVGKGDTIEVETPVDGRSTYTVAEVVSDTVVVVSPVLAGTAAAFYRVNSHTSRPSQFIRRPSYPSGASSVGDYIQLTSSRNRGVARVVEAINPYTVRLDTPFEVEGADIPWVQTTGMVSVLLGLSEGTGGKRYQIEVTGLRKTKTGESFAAKSDFLAVAEKPQLTGASFLADGTVLLDYSEDMRFDEALTSTSEYTITGPTAVEVRQVLALSPRQLALKTVGIGVGAYTLNVNASGTPKDIAGNPIDPTFNEAIFAATVPLFTRSVFTDKGPIAKPAEILQSGSGVSLHTYTSPIFGPSMSFASDEVSLAGAAFLADHVGLCLDIAGTERNDGRFKILGLVGAAPTSRVRLQASLHLPDANNSAGSWSLIDPRDGEIADDPSDVLVRVNGVPVTPLAVIGLLGQVVLPASPGPTDDVKIDYAWVANPVVDFRRLNSREFNLNNWSTAPPSQHQYKYRIALVTPENYVPEDISTLLAQPLLRQVSYRAYERAYTALLNDPSLLTLNSPVHHIAYPPLFRRVTEVSATYSGNTLPESDPRAPWVRKGSGLASVVSGVLTVGDNTTGPFPGGDPLFWQRDLDLSFSHVFAATWRMRIPTATVPEGVFTGVGFGWSNDSHTVALGYLEEGGVKKLGFLKRGFGNDPSDQSAWTGAIDSFDASTGSAAPLDWSVLHSYRLFRGRDGVVRLFVDGDVQELLRVTEEELPFLSELNAPFDEIQGIFFGSISRPAASTSSWDFVRYVAIPTNPEQSEPSVFVAYEGGVVPEVAAQPWTPVGYHGNEHIRGGRLLLSSTSATDPLLEESVGTMGGDFRGMSRIEPLLSTASDVVLDAQFKVLSHTHGVSRDAIMVAIDDGNRLVQLSLFPFTGRPKMSYPGRSFPEEATPLAWSKAGTASADMFGRTLRLSDTSTTDGVFYWAEDNAAPDSTDRILGSLPNYTFEFRTKVQSYEADSVGFCGVTASVYDGLRDVGVRFVRSVSVSALVSGSGAPTGHTWVDSTKNFSTVGVLPGDELEVGANTYAIVGVTSTTLALNYPVPTSGAYSVKRVTRGVELHSKGQPLSPVTSFDFEWYNKEFHTFRVVKSSAEGSVILSGFAGSIQHFNVGAGVSRFTDTSSLSSLQVGDQVVIRSGPSTGSYPVIALVDATTVELNGLPVQSAGLVWEVQRGRSVLVSLLIDDDFVGSVDYDEFVTASRPTPMAEFGSATGASDTRSVVDWLYFNVWGLQDPTHRYAGIWKGFDADLLTGYYLPSKISGAAQVTSTLSGVTYLTDAASGFVVAGVAIGDHLIVDDGPNKGVYTVESVSAGQVGVKPAMPTLPTQIAYRVAKTLDWSVDHRYRIVRDPSGSVALFIDAEPTPQIRLAYNELNLPASSAGRPFLFANKLPSVSWGSFDTANLSQTDWGYVRYGVVTSPAENRIVPPHQVLNQRNVMSSPEHLKGSVVHDHTQHSASSTGVPYPWKAYVENDLVGAFTKLNEGTPIVPLTQTYEVRRPTPVLKPVSALNNPSDVLNSDQDFLLNDATVRVELIVPNDVLYNCLEIVEKTSGEDVVLLEPFTDSGMQALGPFNYTKDVCLRYDGAVLPENDTSPATPWSIASEPSAVYTTTSQSGLLTYGVSGGQTLYRNDTPLTDPASLDTEVSFVFTVESDATTGTGDSGIRVGFSAFGLTAALAFITTPLGDREVRLLDLNTNEVLGSIFFDYLDGQPHSYRLKKNVEVGAVEFSIDA